MTEPGNITPSMAARMWAIFLNLSRPSSPTEDPAVASLSTGTSEIDLAPAAEIPPTSTLIVDERELGAFAGLPNEILACIATLLHGTDPVSFLELARTGPRLYSICIAEAVRRPSQLARITEWTHVEGDKAAIMDLPLTWTAFFPAHDKRDMLLAVALDSNPTSSVAAAANSRAMGAPASSSVPNAKGVSGVTMQCGRKWAYLILERPRRWDARGRPLLRFSNSVLRRSVIFGAGALSAMASPSSSSCPFVAMRMARSLRAPEVAHADEEADPLPLPVSAVFLPWNLRTFDLDFDGQGKRPRVAVIPTDVLVPAVLSLVHLSALSIDDIRSAIRRSLRSLTCLQIVQPRCPDKSLQNVADTWTGGTLRPGSPRAASPPNAGSVADADTPAAATAARRASTVHAWFGDLVWTADMPLKRLDEQLHAGDRHSRIFPFRFPELLVDLVQTIPRFLCRLSLAGTLGPAGLQLLARALPDTLTHLSLAWTGAPPGASGPVGDAAAMALADRIKDLSRFESLDLKHVARFSTDQRLAALVHAQVGRCAT
ncbi:hypothetical protein GGF32_001627 [Allomyces javanicus]|nr:hypothetical protein GGF32_001627 [Allomyces javanicus]